MAQTGATPAISAVNSKTIVTAAAATDTQADSTSSTNKKKGISLEAIAEDLIDPRTGKKSQLAARYGDTTLGTNPTNLNRLIGRAVSSNGVPNNYKTKTVIPPFSDPFGGTVDPRALDEQLQASGLNLAAPGSQPFPPFFPSFNSQGSVGGGPSPGTSNKTGSGKSRDSGNPGGSGTSGISSGPSDSTGPSEAELAIAREEGRLEQTRDNIIDEYLDKRGTGENLNKDGSSKYLSDELHEKLKLKTGETAGDFSKAVESLIKDLNTSPITDEGRKQMIQEFIDEHGLKSTEEIKQIQQRKGPQTTFL